MSWREFWFVRNKVKKFWRIKLSGKSYTVVAGRKGAERRTTTKGFDNEEEAEKAYRVAISLALSKSYREGGEEPTTIWDAVWEGNVTAVRALLAADPGLSKERAPEGETPLHIAARDGRCDIAKLLLEAGADVNARGGEDRDTPLGVAITEFSESGKKQRDVRMIELLLQHRPDLSVADRWDRTLLRRALEEEELAELFDAHGVSPDADPVAKLIQALEDRGTTHVQKLLEANPKLLKSPRIGELLGLAVMGRDRALGFVSFLLDRGVSPDVTCHGQPLIAWAVEQGGGPKVVRRLLERGADLKRLDKGGRSLLLSAVYVRADKQIINDLIRYGVKKDLIVQLETDGAKAVLAEIRQNPAMVRELDDPVELMNRGIGSEELVESLLKLGVDPNGHGTDKEAPLRLAVKKANVKLVRLLLDHGADPNPNDSQADHSDSVLYEGMQEAHAERLKTIVDLLIAKGAKTDAGHEEWMKRLEALIARRARKKKK